MKRSLLAGSAILGVSVLALAGCAPADQSGKSDGEHTVSIAVPIAPGLNPLAVNDNSSNTLRSLGYSYLVNVDPATGKIREEMASSWKEDPDGVTVTLKDGLTCSDGSEITPTVAAKSFEWVLEQENASPLLGSSVPRGAVVSADDAAGTLTISTPVPNSFTLSMTSRMPILCGPGAEDPKSLESTFSGSGMYKLDDFTEGQSYTYSLRKDFAWGPGGTTAKEPGVPAKVVVQVVPNESTVANMLATGEINIGQVSGTDRTRLDADGLFNKVVPARPGLILYNQAQGRAGADIGVRSALTSALDIDKLASVGSAGFGTPLKSITVAEPAVCTSDAATKSLTPSFNEREAAASLDAAGWTLGDNEVRTKGGNSLALKLLYPSNYGPAIGSAAELIQSQLAKVGAKVELVPSDNYASVLFSAGDWDIVWAPLTISLPTDWQSIFTAPAAPDGPNFASINNGQYEELVAQANTLVGAASCATWERAEEAVLKAVDIVPIVNNTSVFYGSGVKFDVSLGILVGTSLRVAD